jgi:hypothetical protein
MRSYKEFRAADEPGATAWTVQCSAAGARESTCMAFVPAIGTSCFSR